MATGWVRSLQCKSRALEDVYIPTPKHLNNLTISSSCRKSSQSLKDVIVDTTNNKKKKKPRKPNPSSPTRPGSKYHSKSTKSDPASTPSSTRSDRDRGRDRVHSSTSSRRRPDSFFPALTELPEGHPSRNVVEIIFHTSWSPQNGFSGRIEMLFKVQNPPKTVARFEEYREMVKTRAISSRGSGLNRKEDDGRCVADGNEVMRFHCLGPTTAAGEVYDIGGMCAFSGKDTAVCAFSGSGAAHESAGGGKGRRAMLVCRVIAGRVCKRFGLESLVEGRVIGFDSVGGENGELLVLDSRAVLPCFLIIYKL